MMEWERFPWRETLVASWLQSDLKKLMTHV
jgi:hypothetical protein